MKTEFEAMVLIPINVKVELEYTSNNEEIKDVLRQRALFLIRESYAAGVGYKIYNELDSLDEFVIFSASELELEEVVNEKLAPCLSGEGD